MQKLINGRRWGTLTTRARITRVLSGVAVAGLLAGACDVHGISSPGTLAALSVSPNPKTLAINGTQQFTATGSDASGRPVNRASFLIPRCDRSIFLGCGPTIGKEARQIVGSELR